MAVAVETCEACARPATWGANTGAGGLRFACDTHHAEAVRFARRPPAGADPIPADSWVRVGKRQTRENFLPPGATDAFRDVDWKLIGRTMRDYPGGPVAFAKEVVKHPMRALRGNPDEKCAWHPDRDGPYLALVPGRGGIIPTTCCAECASRLSRGEATKASRESPVRPNPSLILVTGNPRPPAEVEKAWCKFHQKDGFTGTLRDVGRIPGAPDYVFALGRCVDVDLGRGPQKFAPAPWLVCAPADDALWIVAEKPMRLGSGVAGAQVHGVTYAPTASSGKEVANYRHKFESPLPSFSPVGNPNYCRAIMLQGGGYRVAGEEWIYA